MAVKINGSIRTVGNISGNIRTNNGIRISGSIGRAVTEIVPVYDGPYNVTPILNDSQVLETGGLKMAGDVTVTQIPVTWTTNTDDGWTVVIG